jgi:hypothetical protein
MGKVLAEILAHDLPIDQTSIESHRFHETYPLRFRGDDR